MDKRIEIERDAKTRKEDAIRIIDSVMEDESLIVMKIKRIGDDVQTQGHNSIVREDLPAVIQGVESVVENLKEELMSSPDLLMKMLFESLSGDDDE